jgi:hypothetical protein
MAEFITRVIAEAAEMSIEIPAPNYDYQTPEGD